MPSLGPRARTLLAAAADQRVQQAQQLQREVRVVHVINILVLFLFLRLSSTGVSTGVSSDTILGRDRSRGSPLSIGAAIALLLAVRLCHGRLGLCLALVLVGITVSVGGVGSLLVLFVRVGVGLLRLGKPLLLQSLVAGGGGG